MGPLRAPLTRPIQTDGVLDRALYRLALGFADRTDPAFCSASGDRQDLQHAGRGDQLAVVHFQIFAAAIVGANVHRTPPLSTDRTTNRWLIALCAGHAP